MSDIAIERIVERSKGRYVARVPGIAGEGVLSYSIANPTLIIADHTGVDASLRGQGVAGALVERLIADARAEGVSIVPLCPFVNAQRRKHPEWSDLFR